jgi:hypothetical protein
MAEAIFSGDRTIKLVKQLIRYDVPFLLLGKSSIGKSYSIIEMTERWRMPKSLLYIGSEKPSNIEGLPRLTGTRAGGDILEFYKPNWFPSTFQIEAYVTNGKKIFDEYIDKHFDGDKEGCKSGTNFKALESIFEGLFVWEWESNTTTKQAMKIADVDSGGLADKFLNDTPMEVQRELFSDAELFKMQNKALDKGEDAVVRDDVRDLCLYLSTMLGYGNFWLILDELDKVDEAEQDKYAPLLHIVRERIIKEYSMRTLNEGKGAGVPRKVKPQGDYSTIKDQLDKAISLKMPLLDTRIIGIANATEDIEDALFRRFCHLIIEEVMMVSAPPTELMGMRMCLNDVTKDSNSSALMEDLEFKLLNEVNLQWQFGFLPVMLNANDAGNNYIIQDFMDRFAKARFSQSTMTGITEGKKNTQEELYLATNTTALFKIIRNNFGVDDDMGSASSIRLQTGVYKCLASAILGGDGGYSMETAGKALPDRDSVAEQAVKSKIETALSEAGGDPDLAAQMLLVEWKSEAAKVTSQPEAQKAITTLLSLVESSKETSLRQPIVDQFYPYAIEFIAKPYPRANSDAITQLIKFVNAFILEDIGDKEVSEKATKVDEKALMRLTFMNVMNALMAKQVKLKPSLDALKSVGMESVGVRILNNYIERAKKRGDDIKQNRYEAELKRYQSE